MLELFRRICTRPRYAGVFLIICFIAWLFFWRMFNPESFVNTMNGFWRDIVTMFWLLVKLACVSFGILFMFRAFTKKSGGHK